MLLIIRVLSSILRGHSPCRNKLPRSDLFFTLEKTPRRGRVHGRGDHLERRRDAAGGGRPPDGADLGGGRCDRRRKSVVHATRDIIRQRVYGLLLGHEDLNDHGRLRLDPALLANRRFVNGKLRRPQAAVMRDGAMASPSTLCRFERRSGPWEALMLHRVLFDQLVKAHPP